MTRRRAKTVTLAVLAKAATENASHWVCCRANRTLCGFPIAADCINDDDPDNPECWVCNDLVGLAYCPHDGKECPNP